MKGGHGKGAKGGIMTTSHQMEDVGKEMEILIKEPNGNTGLEKHNDQNEDLAGGVRQRV